MVRWVGAEGPRRARLEREETRPRAWVRAGQGVHGEVAGAEGLAGVAVDPGGVAVVDFDGEAEFDERCCPL